MSPLLGHLVQSFFNDYLPVQKGLRLGSIRSYRDTVSLLLRFLSKHKHRPVAKLALEDLTLDSVLGFLAHLEQERRNSPRTRNQRRAALTTFFSYLAVRVPEMLAVCQQIVVHVTARENVRQDVAHLFANAQRADRRAFGVCRFHAAPFSNSSSFATIRAIERMLRDVPLCSSRRSISRAVNLLSPTPSP